MSDILGNISEPCKGKCVLPDGAAGPTPKQFSPSAWQYFHVFLSNLVCKDIHLLFVQINVQRHVFRMQILL